MRRDSTLSLAREGLIINKLFNGKSVVLKVKCNDPDNWKISSA